MEQRGHGRGYTPVAGRGVHESLASTRRERDIRPPISPSMTSDWTASSPRSKGKASPPLSRTQRALRSSDVFGSTESKYEALMRDDASSTAGIFELDTDGTSGSETDDPGGSAHSALPQRISAGRHQRTASHHARTGRGSPMPPPYRLPWSRTSDGSTSTSASTGGISGPAQPMLPTSRSFRNTPSFSSPLASAPTLPNDDEAPGPRIRPSSSMPRASTMPWHSRRTSSNHRVTPPSSMGYPESSAHGGPAHYLSPRHAMHRRSRSSASMPGDVVACNSPIGGPDGVDPGLIAAIGQGPPPTRRSVSALPMHSIPLSPPGEARSLWTDSPMSSPGLRRDTIRLQRVPRNVARANDLVVPTHTARETVRLVSPQPSPTEADMQGPMKPTTLLGLALAWPSENPSMPHAPQIKPELDANILSISRAIKAKRWQREATQPWDDAWYEHADVHAPCAMHACAHMDSVRTKLQHLETSSPLYTRLADGIHVTASTPCLASLRRRTRRSMPRAPSPGRPRKPDTPGEKARVVSEKWTSKTLRRPSSASIDDSDAAQKQQLWNELVEAKASCDQELDKILTGIITLSDELLDQCDMSIDPDTTSVEVKWDGPMPLALLERLASIAVDVRTTSLHTLLHAPSRCSAAIAGVQALGTLWDEHPDWQGRGWYVESLLTLAALSRVLEWWDAEHQFWSDDQVAAATAAMSMTTSASSSRRVSRGAEPSSHDTTPSPSKQDPPAEKPVPGPPKRIQTSSMLLELTLDLHIQFLSSAWQRVVGMDPAELMDEPVSKILIHGGTSLLERAMRQLRESGGHTVEVTLDIAVLGTESAHTPYAMTAQGMLVHHHATHLPSHTMWVLSPRDEDAPDTDDVRVSGTIGGLPNDTHDVSTELVLCRICERDIPSWFFAKHSEICHEMHRLEMELGTCNEALLELHEAASALYEALRSPEPLASAPHFRNMPLASVSSLEARRILSRVLRALDEAMNISVPSLPASGELDREAMLSPTSRQHMRSLHALTLPQPRDEALALLYHDANTTIQNKIHAVNRMRNTIVYVETVRLESEMYLDSQRDAEADTEEGREQRELASSTAAAALPTATTTAVTAPALVVGSASVEESMSHALQDMAQLQLASSPTKSRPTDESRSAMPIPISRRPLLSTPPLSPFLAPNEPPVARSLGRSPRMGTTPHSPHILPPAQSRSTAASIRDFALLKPISKGAYGSVFLARKRATGDLFAIKVLKKADMIAKNQVTNVRAERMILMNRTQSPFVVKLFFTFQSPEFLYLVMEFLPGGDCASLLKVFGTLPEEWAKQYTAEIVQGVDYLHSTGVVHRDMKPDNLLIDHHGHLKLTDFGLSKFGLLGRHRPKWVPTHDERAHATWAQLGAQAAPEPVASVNDSPTASMTMPSSSSPSHTEAFLRSMSSSASTDTKIVGTPDYLAPESILGIGMDDFGVDWWAVGAILFEFLHGYPPFHAPTPDEVFNRILSHDIAWDDEENPLAPEAHDLISRWLCMDRTQRLGAHGIDEIKRHAYFHDVDWDHLTDHDGPFVPQLQDEAATDYFDPRGAVPQLWHDDDEAPEAAAEAQARPPMAKRSSASSVGANEFGAFSYKNLPVLKQANDEVLRRMRMEHGIAPSSSPAASATSSTDSPAGPGTPSSQYMIPRTFSSPVRRPSRQASAVSMPVAVPETERHVLLADSNPVSRKILQVMLTSISATVTTVHDGADLVQTAMSDTKFDAILIKLGMRVIDVQDGVRMIKSTRNPNVCTPILALVTGDTHVDVTGSVFDGVLSLPATPASIAHVLSGLYDTSEAAWGEEDKP